MRRDMVYDYRFLAPVTAYVETSVWPVRYGIKHLDRIVPSKPTS